MPSGGLLIVVDDDDLREALVDVLGSRGYRVAQAADAEHGLQHLHAEPRPEVVLLDLLHDRPGASEMLDTLGRDPALVDTTVFLFAPPQGEAAADRAGLLHLFPRPVPLEVLLPAIDAVLGR